MTDSTRPSPEIGDSLSTAAVFPYMSPAIKVLMVQEGFAEQQPGGCPEDLVDYWWQTIPKAVWYDPAKECVVVFALNRKNRIIGNALVSLGTATASLAHAREVFRPAIALAATAIAILHNHPSGDPTPSAADVDLTRQLFEASRILDIDLIDHIVIGVRERDPKHLGYYSFRSNGVVLSFEKRALISRVKKSHAFQAPGEQVALRPSINHGRR